MVVFLRRTKANIVILVCCCVLCIIFTMQPQSQTIKQIHISRNTQNRKLMILGIISNKDYVSRRNNVRSYVIKQIENLNVQLPFEIQYKFFLDNMTKETVEENMKYNDIVFMNTSITGYAVSFGYKLYIYYKFVAQTFPDVELVARMDDDTFLCVKHFLSRINLLKNPLLFYGYKNKFNLMDEQLFVIGKEILKRVTQREFCQENCDSSIHITDNMYGTAALHLWLKPYNDVIYFYDNGCIFHCLWRLLWDNEKKPMKKQIITPQFCLYFVSFHSAENNTMEYLFTNSLLNFPSGDIISPDLHHNVCT